MPRPSRRALRVREVMPGFVERTSLMRTTNSRASCARPFRHFRHALAAANGDLKIKIKIKNAVLCGDILKLVRR